MDRIGGFWTGAQDYGQGVDLVAAAAHVGGWAALISGGEAALAAAGVPAKRARRWAAARPRTTLGRAITLMDLEYPPQLRGIPGAPAVLFVEGEPAVLSLRGVGVVGTRSCTRYGAAVADHLGGALAAAGVSVVSGLARGVDGHAHRGALRAGSTVAVLGHGLAQTSPPAHRRLRQRIVDSGGAIVSTWPDDFGPQRWTFPRRNRWIAGLSERIVVVEAPHRSGALITARAALEIGRDVYAVPGPVGCTASAGCLSLLADGAGVVSSVDEFVAELVGFVAPARDAWLDAMFGGATIDQASRIAGRPVSELLADLSRLELQGAVVRLPGQRYARGSAVGGGS